MGRNQMPKLCLNAAAMLGCLQGQTTLTVDVYNYAEVPAGILATAEKESTRVFRAAGITLTWAPCPVSEADLGKSPEKFDTCLQSANAPIVRIETEGTRRRGPVAAVAEEDQVWLSYAWIHRICDLVDVGPGVLLGHVMTHELGHLLLGDNSHAPEGIMTAAFREREFRSAQTGRLLFDRRQAAQMRATLGKRFPMVSTIAAN